MTQKARPAVSVITALYNAEAFIGATIESVLSQGFSDWEMIIVDDCSTDGSAAVVAGYAARDPRIVLVSLAENSGAAVARNRAIELARGRYLAFLDSDDRWHPDKLQKQLAFMQDNSYAFTHTWYERQDEAGRPLGGLVRPPAVLGYRDLLKTNFIACLTVIYDTDRLGKVFMPLIRKRQDYGLWLKILKMGEKARVLPENLAVYRVRPGSISGNKLEMVRFNWALYHGIEGFGLLRSAYYVCWNILYKLRSSLVSAQP
jgi:glycosyltransferase involved in cell wall biosynthesis